MVTMNIAPQRQNVELSIKKQQKTNLHQIAFKGDSADFSSKPATQKQMNAIQKTLASLMLSVQMLTTTLAGVTMMTAPLEVQALPSSCQVKIQNLKNEIAQLQKDLKTASTKEEKEAIQTKINQKTAELATLEIAC